MTINKRTLWVFVFPVGICYLVWFLYMMQTNSWALYLRDWYMAVTMVFGSLVAGASSEGGGAVAYPVMTLAFEITPVVARNFSLVIQAVGMTAAALWITAKRIPIETNYFKYAIVGGSAGIIFSTLVIAPLVPAAYAKMIYVSFWFSFGIALFVINHLRKRTTSAVLPELGLSQKIELVLVGFLGGTLSAIFGNGLDICTFAFVTMKYDLSEKVATPTSVVLMASNAVLGAVLHAFFLADMQPQAVDFWLVCIPVVLLGAPMGAFIVDKIPRLAIAFLLYTLIIVQFAAAWVIIRPSWLLSGIAIITFVIGLLVFFGLTNPSSRAIQNG